MAAITVAVSDLLNAAGGLVLLAIARRRRKERRKRARQPSMPYILNRRPFGAFHSLVQEMASDDPKQLRKFLRMSGETFDELLHLVGPLIEKQDTTYKDSIPPEERLAVTLRYLADGMPSLILSATLFLPHLDLSSSRTLSAHIQWCFCLCTFIFLSK